MNSSNNTYNVNVYSANNNTYQVSNGSNLWNLIIWNNNTASRPGVVLPRPTNPAPQKEPAPTVPTNPVEQPKPEEPAKPAEPANPVEPVKPVTPEAPTQTMQDYQHIKLKLLDWLISKDKSRKHNLLDTNVHKLNYVKNRRIFSSVFLLTIIN